MAFRLRFAAGATKHLGEIQVRRAKRRVALDGEPEGRLGSGGVAERQFQNAEVVLRVAAVGIRGQRLPALAHREVQRGARGGVQKSSRDRHQSGGGLEADVPHGVRQEGCAEAEARWRLQRQKAMGGRAAHQRVRVPRRTLEEGPELRVRVAFQKADAPWRGQCQGRRYFLPRPTACLRPPAGRGVRQKWPLPIAAVP